tara:strand:+ start:1730 stop:2629 length:900 start_codon:yes stop_codon:yes gene_type:complete
MDLKPNYSRYIKKRFQDELVRGYGLISSSFILMIFGLGAPLILLFVLSFWSQDHLMLNQTFSIKNYNEFFDNPIYVALLIKSIKIASIVTVISIVLAYPMAYFISFRIKKNKMLWLVLITVPFWTSYLLRVFAWKIILGNNGVINSGLISLRLIEEPLTFLLYSPIAIIITLAHAWAPFAVLPIYLSLNKINRDLLAAARDLGESAFMTFARVTLPLSLPGIIIASLLVFIPTVGDYVTPSLVGGPQGIMIGNIIQSMFGESQNWPMGATISMMLIAIVAILSGLIAWIRYSYHKHGYE